MTQQSDGLKKRVDVAIAVVVRNGSVLICQRRHDDPLGGYWEFPGGKRNPHESNEECLARELREELAIEARAVEALPTIEHDYPHIHVRLYPYRCEHLSGEPQPLAADRVLWAAPADLRHFKFLPANDDLIRSLVEFLTRPPSPQHISEPN